MVYHMIGYYLIDRIISFSETPPNAKYYKHDPDLNVVADMFEEWKHDKIKEQES